MSDKEYKLQLWALRLEGDFEGIRKLNKKKREKEKL